MTCRLIEQVEHFSESRLLTERASSLNLLYNARSARAWDMFSALRFSNSRDPVHTLSVGPLLEPNDLLVTHTDPCRLSDMHTLLSADPSKISYNGCSKRRDTLRGTRGGWRCRWWAKGGLSMTQRELHPRAD